MRIVKSSIWNPPQKISFLSFIRFIHRGQGFPKLHSKLVTEHYNPGALRLNAAQGQVLSSPKKKKMEGKCVCAHVFVSERGGKCSGIHLQILSPTHPKTEA